MSMFGEVQMGMSRAVSDDEDDEYSIKKEDLETTRKINWLTEQYADKKLVVDDLIVADGPIASALTFTYMLSHLKESQLTRLGLTSTKSELKVYQLNHQNSQSWKIDSLRTNVIFQVDDLIKPSSKAVVCQLFNPLKPDELYSWIDQIWSRVEFKRILVLSSQSSSNYLGDQEQTFPCVKYVTTEKAKTGTSICSKLEEPNFMDNLPAALIHFGIFRSIPITSFVCYSRSLTVDIPTLKEFERGVSDYLKQDSIFKEDELAKKTLLQMNKVVNSVTDLYI